MTTLEALDNVLFYVSQTIETDHYRLSDGSVIDLRVMAIKLIELRDQLKKESEGK